MGDAIRELADERAQTALVHGLERAGWQLLTCEIDLSRRTARVELKSFNGRLLTLDARDGRATLTREQLEVESVPVGRRGDRCRVDRMRTRLLGRTRHEGARSALRSLCNYVEDNAPAGALPRATTRALFAPLMGRA